jgi:acyl-CoA reductase-like NAD-dependent aldehyde dehydrogenase
MARPQSATVVPIGIDPGNTFATLETAWQAQRHWGRLQVPARLRTLAEFRDRLAADARELAATMQQRPVGDSLAGEILPLLEACRFLERRAVRLLRAQRRRARVGAWLRGTRLDVYPDAYGTVLIVGPSNYGLMLPGIQALQALVAGNAVIVKPAPGTAVVLQRFAELLEHSGLPRGLLQITDAAPERVHELLAGGIDLLVFTGSGAAGRVVLKQAAAQMVPVIAELSGWDACIVLETADLERAARAIAFALRFNAGETCLAPRRITVARDCYADFISRLRQQVSRIPAQPFRDDSRATAGSLIAAALEQGAELACGELGHAGPVGPVVLTGVTETMSIFRQEVFGPIALVSEFADSFDAVAQANATDFALGATIFGAVREARNLATQLDAGVVMINDAIVPAAHPALPIAPRRGSGFGVTRGPEGLLAFTRPRAVVTSSARRPPHLTGAAQVPETLLGAYIAAAYRRRLGARIRAALTVVATLRRWFTNRESD